MKKILALIFAIGSTVGFSQTSDFSFQFDLPTHEFITRLQWADIDNDSLLDVVIGYKDQNTFHVSAYINRKEDPWPVQPMISTPYSDQINFELSDINKDNQLDVIIINEVEFLTRYYFNKGNLIFAQGSGWGSRDVFNKGIQFADMNNDGNPEIIWTDGAQLSILNKLDTTFQKIEAFLALDLDMNGFRDLIFSGFDTNNKPVTFAWFFGDNFKILKRLQVANLAGLMSFGDMNNDGFFDIIISGTDLNGNKVTQLFENHSNTNSIIPSTTYTTIDAAILKIADFDSDGSADVAIFGKDAGGNPMNDILFTGYSTSYPTTNVNHQDFGDYDRDGDLDLAQVTDVLTITNRNPGPGNKGPSSPFGAIAFQFLGRIFIYWEKSIDDHTNIKSVTYDLKVLSKDSTFTNADFDDSTKYRLTVSHGNTGTNNFSLQRLDRSFSYEIQSIDNAFVTRSGSLYSNGGICSGVGTSCASLEQVDIIACDAKIITLEPKAPQAMWFSFKRGFVGIMDSYEFDPVESDTIFSFNPSTVVSCANLKVFNVAVNPTDTVRLSSTHFDCIGRNIALEVPSPWYDVTWRNNLNSTIVNAQSFVHPFEKEIKYTAYASNDYGCKLKAEFLLKVSQPNLQVNGTQFQIMKGSELQLVATGGNAYQWSPGTYLTNSQIADPITSPDQTIEYIVTAYDSIGCEDSKKILVEVFEQAFIPTLFTPNADGKNDNLRIYGLAQANGFRFAIYNREGSKLFETTSVQEATSIGWSGSVNGTRQPPGTYYWKVEGSMPNGELLLNGKKNGIVLLVR